MNIVSAFIFILCVWIVAFFMALPIGVRVDEPEKFGHATSAPSQPRVFIKLIASLLVAIFIFLAVYTSTTLLGIEL